MKESAARLMVKEMKSAGIKLLTCLPDGGLKELYFLCRDDPDFEFVPVTNEGEGAAIAAGAWLGGKRSLMFMENSGIRVASEVLSRLSIGLEIPVLLLMSYRGSIGEGNWWGENHGVMMEPMLKALRIPYIIIEREEDIEGSLRKAIRTVDSSKHHVAIVIGGGLLW
jgi:sulfopyruvate decarboxylase subunit alpha